MKSTTSKILFSLFSLLLTQSITAQKQSEGLPITIEVKTPKNYTDGSVELGGITSSIDNKPAQIQIEIKKPNGVIDKLIARADKTSGEYLVKYFPKFVGSYTATATSPDKLLTAKAEFAVELDWKSEEEIDKASAAVGSTMQALEAYTTNLLSTGGFAQIDITPTKEKLKKVKDNTNEYVDALTKIKEAIESINELVKKYPDFGPYVKMPSKVGKLGSTLNELTQDMGKVKETLNGASLKGEDVCGRLNALSEACGFISTAMNLKSLNIISIIKNIAIDKAWPKFYDDVLAPKKLFSDSDNFLVKQAGKALATSEGKLENLKKTDVGISVVGDLTQFISDQVIKKYCTKYTGPLTGEYALEFKNNGKRYMYYKYKYEGKITLMAKKATSEKEGAQFSGFIEANINNVIFDDDVWAVEDKSKWIEMSYRRLKMIVVPFNMSEKDPGFGAIARQAMPGAFYFPIKGKLVQNKMVIELQSAMIELSETNANRTVMVVSDPNNVFATKGVVFTYPTTTAKFILTRTMRMPENNPKTSVDIKKENEKNIIVGDFTRTETPADTKVDFKLTFKMTQE